MRILDLMNPSNSSDDEDVFDLEESRSPKNKTPHAAALELVYKTIKDGNPPTKLLNELMTQYPSISSLIYLRSWFNNRHNKYKRYVNMRREKILDLLRSYSLDELQINEEKISFKQPIDIKLFKSSCQLLDQMQSNTAKYLAVINKLDD